MVDENRCMAPLAGNAAASGGSEDDEEDALLIERKGNDVSLSDAVSVDWGDDSDEVVVVVVVVVVVFVTTELTELVRPEKSKANGFAIAANACLLGVAELLPVLVGAFGAAVWSSALPLALADVGRLALELADTGRPP